MADLIDKYKKEIYLAVPIRDGFRIEELIISLAEETDALWKHNKAMITDDYIFMIVSQYAGSRNSFVKLYPTGDVSLHMFCGKLPDPIVTFRIETNLLEKAKSFARDYFNSVSDMDKDTYDDYGTMKAEYINK